MTAASDASRYRWLVLAVFVLSSAINYLDRQTLAALAPVVEGEFQLTRAQMGWILGAFSACYAASAPFAGMLIDRIGLNRAMSLVVAVWSSAGIATGFTTGLGGLTACRMVLGAAEAGGVPGTGKAIHQYLKPAERALGNAVNQAGISLGAVLAPSLATWMAVAYGWRSAFIVTGALGLLWIPLWNWTARRAGSTAVSKPGHQPGATRLLHDRRLWAFVAANALCMVGYSLWTNWTTQYLVDEQHLTLQESVHYSWIPPAFAMAGGFAGGWLSQRFMRAGMAAMDARFRVCLLAAVLTLITAAVPAAPSAAWAAALISAGIFAVAAFSVNMYSLPLDAFGGTRAAFAVSMLVASYGALQFLISPGFGRLMDLHRWPVLTTIAALSPMAACAVLKGLRSLE